MTIFLGFTTAILLVAFVVAIWYIRGLIKVMLQMTSGVKSLKSKMVDFAKHLENVYEMEMYYGDETLSQLIRHSKELVDNINQFEELFEIENDRNENETE